MSHTQSEEGTLWFTKSITVRQLTSLSTPASHTAHKHPLQRHRLKSSVSPTKACWLHNLSNNPVPSLQDVNHHPGIDLQWVAFKINIWKNVVSNREHAFYNSKNGCLQTVGPVQDQWSSNCRNSTGLLDNSILQTRAADLTNMLFKLKQFIFVPALVIRCSSVSGNCSVRTQLFTSEDVAQWKL